MHGVVVWIHPNRETTWAYIHHSGKWKSPKYREKTFCDRRFCGHNVYLTVNKLSTNDFVLELFLSLTFECLMG